jgi:hypothetical protein
MGMFARRKGRAGEQELARMLRQAFSDIWDFERNSMQSRHGGDDLCTNAPFSFEVKRVEKPSWTSWIKQAIEQAARHKPPKVPVVAHRANHGPWTFTMHLSAREFCHVARALHHFSKLPREEQQRLINGPTGSDSLPALDFKDAHQVGASDGE